MFRRIQLAMRSEYKIPGRTIVSANIAVAKPQQAPHSRGLLYLRQPWRSGYLLAALPMTFVMCDFFTKLSIITISAC